MSEDNRQRPHILRVLPAVNVRVRAYATRQGIAPNVAAEGLINGAAAEIAALDSQLVALRADLESAREATRRADQEIETLRAELTRERASDEAAQEALRADVAREIEAAKRAEKEVERLRAELAATRPAPCACAALPDDFEAKLTERAPGWPGTLPELRARVIQLGFSRYDALATDAAKRAAERAARG